MAAVWVSILGSTVCLAAGLAGFSLSEFHKVRSRTDQQEEIFLTSLERISQAVTSSQYFWLGLVLVFSCVAALLSLLLCCCFKRISVATDMIGEASRAIRDISGSLVFPLLPFLLHLLLVFWFLTVGVFLLSSRVEQFHVIQSCPQENCSRPDGQVYTAGDSCQPHTFSNCSTCPDSACVFHRFGPRPLHLGLQWVNIAIFLWSVGVVSGLGDCTIAGAVAQWYWTFNKQTDLKSNMLR